MAPTVIEPVPEAESVMAPPAVAVTGDPDDVNVALPVMLPVPEAGPPASFAVMLIEPPVVVMLFAPKATSFPARKLRFTPVAPVAVSRLKAVLSVMSCVACRSMVVPPAIPAKLPVARSPTTLRSR